MFLVFYNKFSKNIVVLKKCEIYKYSSLSKYTINRLFLLVNIEKVNGQLRDKQSSIFNSLTKLCKLYNIKT